MNIAGIILSEHEVCRIAEEDPTCMDNHRQTVRQRSLEQCWPRGRITQRLMHLLLDWQKRAAVRRHITTHRAAWNAAHGRNFNSVNEAFSKLKRAA